MAFVTIQVLDIKTENYVRKHGKQLIDLINEMLTAAWNPGPEDRVIRTLECNHIPEASQYCGGLCIIVATTNQSGIPALLKTGNVTNLTFVNELILELSRWERNISIWLDMWQQNKVFGHVDVEFKPDNHERIWAAILNQKVYRS